jgi:predicted neuraminidase
MGNSILFGIFVIMFSLGQAAVTDQFCLIREEFLSADIPNFDCHSSSIAETSDGNFCAVWKGGPGIGKSNRDIKKNIGIWSCLFDGNQWSDPIEIVSARRSVCWNPVLFHYPSKDLLLFYRIGPNPRHTVSFVKRSKDGGQTWSKEEILPAGIRGPTKNKPILNAEGILLCPSSFAVGEPDEEYKATSCWVEMTEDQGYHWKKIGPLELPGRPFGVIEPAFFYATQGRLKMYCRDRAHKMGEIGYIWEAVSLDEGLHWSAFTQTHFPNPDSALDVIDMGEGRLMLIYNHSHTDRFPLHFAVSFDGGTQWSEPYVLDDVGEFPAAILSKEGQIHITYAAPSKHSEQRRIKHVVMNFDVLRNFQVNQQVPQDK